jgi:hypothetical protein
MFLHYYWLVIYLATTLIEKDIQDLGPLLEPQAMVVGSFNQSQ